jgi:hypothetical protein
MYVPRQSISYIYFIINYNFFMLYYKYKWYESQSIYIEIDSFH